jgi:xylan 1,4-beta-xylosidase
VSIQRVDQDHGNVLKQYLAMGQPLDPTPDQVVQLNRESGLPALEDTRLQAGKLQLSLAPNSLALIKIKP